MEPKVSQSRAKLIIDMTTALKRQLHHKPHPDPKLGWAQNSTSIDLEQQQQGGGQLLKRASKCKVC